jgi:catechol 2,3-dioxygenase-like lactoylglutathione lyase family enzyme
MLPAAEAALKGVMMLHAANIVAFVATVDSARSRAFYEGVLGLRVISDDPFSTVYDANGVELRLQKVSAFTPQPHTSLGWSVSSIHDSVRAVASRGAVFEKYPHMKQDTDGVWDSPSGAKVAWFKDPDGNLLSLTQPPSA